MATRTKICAGNWKMYKTPSEARDFLVAWSELRTQSASRVLIFPPAYDLAVFSEHAVTAHIEFGSQNIYFEKEGAFTGEISPAAIRAMGGQWALIGHSERRQLFGETDEVIAKKVRAATQFQLQPLLCVGETLAERQAGRTNAVVQEQVVKGLSQVQNLEAAPFAIAYEPVWAIGTGQVATPEQAEEVHAFIRQLLAKNFGAEISQMTSILYGGSVKPDNCKGLASQENIDGFLVGGASLKPQDFSLILASL